MPLRPHDFILFPYTTLFRSHAMTGSPLCGVSLAAASRAASTIVAGPVSPIAATPEAAREAARSEEHTSELQSPDHLVCRLLLEKKKNHTAVATPYPTKRPIQ